MAKNEKMMEMLKETAPKPNEQIPPMTTETTDSGITKTPLPKSMKVDISILVEHRELLEGLVVLLADIKEDFGEEALVDFTIKMKVE